MPARRKCRLIPGVAALLLGGSVTAWAAPNMYWDHLQSTLSQAECVNKAESILVAEKAGRISKDADSVRSWSEKVVGVVECIPSDGKLMVFVLAGSDDASAATNLFNALKNGMQK